MRLVPIEISIGRIGSVSVDDSYPRSKSLSFIIGQSSTMLSTTEGPTKISNQIRVTSVNYHGNVEVSMLLNHWLALTILQATGRR